MKELPVLIALIMIVNIGCDLNLGEIGSIGPGGGFVFFAEDGQYMECSGHLGYYTWGDAVTIAYNYRSGGYSDWRLPNQNELDLIYKNLRKNGIGNFNNSAEYWTSLVSGSNAWVQDFRNGSQYLKILSYYSAVLVIRSYNVEPEKATLKISNQSSKELFNVTWRGIPFRSNQLENSIKPGNDVTNSVDAGQNYIFFSFYDNKDKLVNARTSEFKIIENVEQESFPFNDSTFIVELNNPNNITNRGQLGTFQNTVIWFDDAEGTIKPYSLRLNAAYVNGTEIIPAKSGIKYIHISPNGELTFNVSLERKALLSFWHKADGTPSILYINEEERRTWTVNNDWSYFEFHLNTGNYKIKFITESNSNLYIDDILVYYTE